ncbi:MAG: DNA polymerase III subunit alpha [Prevotella sp.]|nr:DNA polymerase III subunit alpha [Prevotella sp.]MCM1074727.1 DNA polymerase III subunit alpha [Ruminococcus sp.]
MPDFVHLHVHSQYSLLDGQASVSGIVDKAISLGMKGIALTDHGNMFGIKEFFNYVNKKNKGKEDSEKFKPILGCEMYVAKNDLHDRGDKSDKGYHLIVLAKNLKGYHNLVKLVSKAWTEGEYYKPRTDHKELEAHSEGLIICSACLGGEVPQQFMNESPQKAEETILWYKKVFGDDYYLELQRHKTDKPDGNRRTFEEQESVNPFLIEMARKHGIKLIATNDSHFVNEEDAEAHDRLICISMGKKFNDPTRMHYTKQEWIKSQEEMALIFPDIPEALSNTNEILDKVEFYSIDHAPIMPNFEIPQDFGTEEEYRQKFSEQDLFDEFTRDENNNIVLSQEDAEAKIKKLGGYDKLYRIKLEADYLKKLTMEGAKVRYGDPLEKEVEDRLRFELHIMKTMGFPGYFLIVQDFINASRNNLGVSIGPGRGSAAGSAAAYCLGITQIDPIKYDLLFERFLNPDRISLPDIDVDFDDDGRYKALEYVTQKYGAEKVAHIITYGTMATKMAIKDVAKILELPLSESNRLAKLVPDRMPEGKVNFKNCLKFIKEFEAETHNPNPAVRETMKYAQQLEGNVRNTGVHACGVIIGRDDITDWVPVSTAKDTDGAKLLVTQYEGSVIEDTGMIKMDFLGLKTLSIIMEAVENIKNSRGIDIDMEKIPLDDEKTYKLYCEGRTTGTFQFESAGMQKYLRELQPSKFEDLIAMNALYRPGPMDYIPQFIARKQGREPIVYDIDIMEKYLHDTYGITVYQEQVMLLSRLLANFTRGESDVLRKAMGKKLIDKMAALKVKFMDGGQANGHKPEVLEKIWADWEKFASYAFNKSHATCYSWVAYQTAYLKANYPAEYMAGVLSRNLTNIAKLSIFMDECKAMGIPVKGPDINESVNKFGVTKQGEIRFGLGAVKGVGGGAVTAILQERNANGPYKDIFDLVERVNLSACNRAAIESLAFAGAFDCFPDVNREMFASEPGSSEPGFAETLVRYGQRYQADKNSAQASLFDEFETLETEHPAYPKYEQWAPIKLLDEEKRLVGMYLSAHPLDSFYMDLEYGCNTKCANFKEAEVPGRHITMGGLVTGMQERFSKKGTPWGILSIEDFSGKAEIRLFGKAFLEYKHFGVAGTSIFIDAEFQPGRYNPEQLDFNIRNISLLSEIQGNSIKGICLRLNPADFNAELMNTIQSFLCTSGNNSEGKELMFDVFDTETKQHFAIKCNRHIKVNRQLIDSLSDADIDYTVLSR